MIVVEGIEEFKGVDISELKDVDRKVIKIRKDFRGEYEEKIESKVKKVMENEVESV